MNAYKFSPLLASVIHVFLSAGTESIKRLLLSFFLLIAGAGIAWADPVATTTSLVSQANPSYSGDSTNNNFTASVSNNNAGFPVTGSVTFTNGSTELGTAQVDQSGNAYLYFVNYNLLPAGVHNLTAEYSGDANNAPSTGSMVQTVKASTSVGVLSSANPVQISNGVTLTARINFYNSTQPVTGTVTFKDGGTVIGTGTISVVDGYYQASVTTSAFTSGTHTITAEYSGDGLNWAANSNNFQQVVLDGLAPVTVEFGASPNPGQSNGNVSLSAVVSNNNAGFPLTGTVTFKNGSTVLGTTQVGQYGNADLYFLSSSYFPVGVNNLTAEYSGDANNAATTATLAFTMK
ncbi:MAG: Copper resistance protein CopC, partial [Moraxellaceae bacterium]|nr:Copper resistance protein CopC [Moraxellaceae bacterium]